MSEPPEATLAISRTQRKKPECLCRPEFTPRYERGRRFREYERAALIRRTVTGIASNHAWLYTVDELKELPGGMVVLQVVRWQTRVDDRGHKIWLNRARYNIRSLEQWETAATAVESYLSGSQLRKDPEFEEDFSPVGVHQEPGREVTRDPLTAGSEGEVDTLKQQVREERAAKASEQAAKRRANSWLRQVKRHVGKYRRALASFRRLVADPDTSEKRIHDAIANENAFWLFGLDYISLDSNVPFPTHKPAYFFDLMLQRLDGLHDLVELKGPNERLFDRVTSRRGKLNKKLSEALGQVMVYLDACDRFRRRGMFKPKALIVIGKKGTDDPRQRRLMASHLAHVEVLTYSELMERGAQLLRYLDGWKG